MNLNPINEEVYEKTRIFVISALKQLLSSLQKGEKIPATRVETYKVETEGSWIIDHELQPIYLLFMEIHREEIEGLPEYEACVEAMRSDKIISKHLAIRGKE